MVGYQHKPGRAVALRAEFIAASGILIGRGVDPTTVKITRVSPPGGSPGLRANRCCFSDAVGSRVMLQADGACSIEAAVKLPAGCERRPPAAVDHAQASGSGRTLAEGQLVIVVGSYLNESEGGVEPQRVVVIDCHLKADAPRALITLLVGDTTLRRTSRPIPRPCQAGSTVNP
jgi:hypothetical protein